MRELVFDIFARADMAFRRGLLDRLTEGDLDIARIRGSRVCFGKKQTSSPESIVSFAGPVEFSKNLPLGPNVAPDVRVSMTTLLDTPISTPASLSESLSRLTLVLPSR